MKATDDGLTNIFNNVKRTPSLEYDKLSCIYLDVYRYNKAI